MTIQLLQPFNGLMPGVYSNLGASEEARLVALPGAMARYYTPGMDGYDPRLSDSQESAVQALVSGAGNPTSIAGRPDRLYLGDSLTQYSATLGMPITARGGGGFGSANWVYLWADWDCESGAGTLTYDATAKTLQWTPLAGAAGAAVDAYKTGYVYVPGGVAGHGVWVVWYGLSTTYTSGTATLTVGAANTQLWQYPSNVQGGYVPWAQAYGGQAFRLAPFPAGLPNGMDGCFGLGGATSATMLDAYPQWSRIPAYSTVIELGTNDFNTGVTVASYVANIKDIVGKRLALGDRYVVWLTITPRDTDTTTQRQNKAQAAQQLIDWGLTQGNRFHVLDVAQAVTSYATGANQGKFLSGYSIDGVHLAQAGAMAVGKVIGTFDRRMASQGPFLGSVGDTFNATENPYGSILSAVQAGSNWMEGTSGTISTGAVTVAAWASTTAYVLGQPVITGGRLYICTTAGTSGSVAPIHTAGRALDGTVVWEYSASGAVTGMATGWTIARQVGSACVAAVCKVARTDGVPGEWQRVILYGATANEAYRLITAASATGFVAGAQYTLDAEVRHVSSTLLNCLGAQIITDGTSGGKQSLWGIASSSSAYTHTDSNADPGLNLILSTPPKWVTVAASTNLRVGLHLGNQNTGLAVIDFGRTRFRRVA